MTSIISYSCINTISSLPFFSHLCFSTPSHPSSTFTLPLFPSSSLLLYLSLVASIFSLPLSSQPSLFFTSPPSPLCTLTLLLYLSFTFVHLASSYLRFLCKANTQKLDIFTLNVSIPESHYYYTNL